VSGAGEDQPDSAPSPPRPPVIRPLAPARYQVQMTVSAETHAKLQRAQDLLRHRIPNGDPAAIFDRALTVLLDELERTKLAATTHPRAPQPPKGSRRPGHADGPARRTEGAGAPASLTASPAAPSPGAPASRPRSTNHSRHIPAAVKRAVWVRDGAQCTFVGTQGRCAERGLLEIHHRLPYAAGGEATLANVCLTCARHNRHEAAQYFGSEALSRRDDRDGEPTGRPTRSWTELTAGAQRNGSDERMPSTPSARAVTRGPCVRTNL
jgi:hypothetical protein